MRVGGERGRAGVGVLGAVGTRTMEGDRIFGRVSQKMEKIDAE